MFDLSITRSIFIEYSMISESFPVHEESPSHRSAPGTTLILTEEMKLEAVVVTVVRVEEHELRRALARNVHITALQVNSRPPHSSLRGMCS